MNTAEQTLKEVLIEYLEAGKDTSQNRAEAVEEAMIRFAKKRVSAALNLVGNTKLNGYYDATDEKNKIIAMYPLSNII